MRDAREKRTRRRSFRLSLDWGVSDNASGWGFLLPRLPSIHSQEWTGHAIEVIQVMRDSRSQPDGEDSV